MVIYSIWPDIRLFSVSGIGPDTENIRIFGQIESAGYLASQIRYPAGYRILKKAGRPGGYPVHP
jgi:hypothetical protein